MKNKSKNSNFPINPWLLLGFIAVAALSLGLNSMLKNSKLIGGKVNNLVSDEYVKFIKSQTGKFEKNSKVAIFLNKNITAPTAPEFGDTAVLGDQTPPNDNNWIEINLTNQTLYTHEGNSVTHAFLISSGLWGRTPTGTYRTYVKLRYTRMAGGSGADYYNLPNVPFTMYFYKGYGIHGTYWHNNFGHPMSHGCVNMRTSEAEIVYNWAPVGTKVVIHY